MPKQPAEQAGSLFASPRRRRDAEKRAVSGPRGWRDERGEKTRSEERRRRGERRRALEHIHRLTLVEGREK